MMMLNRRRTLGLLGIVPVMGLVAEAAVAGEPLGKLYDKARAEGEVVMYTSVPTFLLDRWKALFERTYPGVTLTTFRSGTGKVLARIESERRAGRVGGDLVWLADPTTYAGLVQGKALLSYRPPEWLEIKLAKEPHGYYAAGRVLAGVLLVNRNILPKPPRGFSDLVKPEFKGKVAIASPLISGSTNIIDGALLEDSRFGWSYFQKLKQNDVLVLNDVPDVARSVASGERAAGISLTMYKYQPEFAGSPMDIVFPSEGTVLIPSPLALLAGAPHPVAARLLYRFLLSQPAQAVIAGSGTYPARGDVAPPAGMPPFGTMKKIIPDTDWIGANQQDFSAHWRQIFGG